MSYTALVILPPRQSFYADREVFAWMPSFRTCFGTNLPMSALPPTVADDVLNLDFRPDLGVWDGANRLLARAEGLSTALAKYEPDLVVTFELHSTISRQITELKRRYAFLHVVRSYETASLGRGLWGVFPPTRYNALKTAKSVDCCLASSSKIRTSLQSCGVSDSRIIHLPLGIRMDSHQPASKRSCSPAGLVTYLGTLRRNKGLVTLLRAFDHYVDRRQLGCELMVAGDGPLLKWLNRRAATRPWLHVPGRVSEHQKDGVLDSSVLFVYPSESTEIGPWVRWEEQGALSVIEAMAHSLPVLVTDSGALPEIIREPGLTVQQRDPQALGSAINRILSDPVALASVGERNRQQVSRENSLVDLGKELDSLMSELLAHYNAGLA